MTTIPEEAVKAAMDEFNRTRRFMTSDTDRIYAAIAAALPHLPQGVGVKKLGWNEHGCATTPFGMYTVEENVDDTWSFTYHEYPFGMPEGEFSTQEAAKSAAQADYEARILSALEPSNKPGTFDLDQISPDQRVNISRPESQRTLEPSATRELVLEERLQAIEQQLVVNLGYFHDEKRILLETLQSHIISHISAIRALSSQDHADAGKVEGDGWLPIETAPKDGTEFIGWDGKWPFRCSAGKKYELYPHMDGGPTYRDVWDGHYYDSLTIEHPTHWRPLPLPPVKGGQND